jgi:hypothetical protein
MLGESEFNIRLLEHNFRVLVESPTQWAEGGMGRASLMDQTIRLNDRMPSDARASTLLHELMHLVSEIFSLGLTETQVDALGLSVLSLIRNNTELIRDLAEQ